MTFRNHPKTPCSIEQLSDSDSHNGFLIFRTKYPPVSVKTEVQNHKICKTLLPGFEMWWVSLSPRPLPFRRQRFQASPPTDRLLGQTICRGGGEPRSGRGAFGNLTPSRSTS